MAGALELAALKEGNPREWEVFEKLDADNSGGLDKDELWCKLAATHDDDSATQLIDMVDLNGDGVVDFDEFLQAFADVAGFGDMMAGGTGGGAHPDAAAAGSDSSAAAEDGQEPREIELTELDDMICQGLQQRRPVLVCDPSERAAGFLSYNSVTLDGKGLFVLDRTKGKRLVEIQEKARR
eukprot:SAG22_NODE_231_length_14551_cov_22.298090_14_plen_181_part_00